MRRARAVEACSTGQTTDRLWSIRSKNLHVRPRRSRLRASHKLEHRILAGFRRGSWVPCRFDKVRCCVTHHAHARLVFTACLRKVCVLRSFVSFNCSTCRVLRRALLCMWRYRIRAWLLHKTHRHTHNDLLERDIASEKCTA